MVSFRVKVWVTYNLLSLYPMGFLVLKVEVDSILIMILTDHPTCMYIMATCKAAPHRAFQLPVAHQVELKACTRCL